MSSRDLSQGAIGSHLYHMALPMTVGLLANMSIQVIDTWFISMLGDKPLAAMGFVFPVAMIFLSLSIGLSAGASSVIARKLPDGDREGFKRLVTDTQLLALLLSVTASIIGWLTIDPLFRMLGAPEYLLPLITDYIQIFYFNAIVTMVAMCALSSVRATGNARLQGSAMLAGAIINAILDPILIFGLIGFPAMELKGAALASLCARLTTMMIAYYVLLGKMHLMTSSLVSLQSVLNSWRKVFHVALPAIGTNVIIPVSAAVITALLASYGESAVAGMGVAGRVEPLMLIAYYALSAVIGPFVGQNLGAREPERIAQGVRVACQFAMALGLLLALIAWLLAEPIVGQFSDLPAVKDVARSYLYIVPISYGCAGVVMIVNASFNGVGKPLPATMVSLMRVIILYLPLAYLGSWLLGYKGIFYAYMAVNIVCGLLAYAWFSRYVKGLQSACSAG